MSTEEDTELRDLVAQTLQTNGTLGKIRAQLRASVFLALEEQESVQNKTPFLNKDLQQFLSTKEGLQVASLVRDFLEFFDLEFTLAVFDPETGLGPNHQKRTTLAKELDLPDSGPSSKVPLLTHVLRTRQNGSKPSPTHTKSTADDAVESISIPKELTEKQIAAAQEKFEHYDKDGSGSIDKEELRELFMDIFPHFHKNMLDRYVNDEFKAIDRNFSNRIYSLTPLGIDFDEFLDMYKRLFLLCRTVVSSEVSDIVTTAPKKMREPPNSPPSSKASNYSQNKNSVNSFDSKNQKKTDNKQTSEMSNGPKDNSLLDFESDLDGDPFFDDPVPNSSGLNLSNRSISPVSESRRHTSPSRIPVFKAAGHKSDDKSKDKKTTTNGTSQQKTTGGMSSLQGLPALTPDKGQTTKANDSSNTSTKNNLRELDKGFNAMGFSEEPEDIDYEDDFQDSIQSSSIGISPRHKSEKSINENGGGSIAEEIEEEDLDSFSIEGEDLLKSDRSMFDDMTTDRSISQADAGFDYAEEVHLP